MYIQRIKEIRNIGTYEKSGNGSIALKPFTFIFAGNTYGKTTFCDILRSLKYNDVSIINQRRRVGISDSEKCEVSLTVGKSDIEFKGDCWHVPSNADIREDIEIFDINFVNENVFTNFKIEHKNKENFTSFVLGQRGVDLIKKLEKYEALLSEKESAIKGKKPALEKNLDGISYDVISKVKYDDNFKDFESLIMSSRGAIKALLKQGKQIDYIKSIKPISLLNDGYSKHRDLISKVREISSRQYDINLSEIKKEIERVKYTNPNLSERWLKEGIKFRRAENECPFCGADTANNNRVNAIALYFSDFIIEIIDEIEATQKILNRDFKESGVATNILKMIQQADIVIPYCDLNPADDEKFRALFQATTDQIDKINSFIPEVKQELWEALERKEASLLSKDFTLPKTEELILQLEQYEEYQKAVNAEIVRINNVFADYQRNLSEDFINKKIAALQDELYSENIIFLRGNYSEEINEIIMLSEHVKELKKKIRDTKAEMDQQQEDFLNKYFDSIQYIFSKLGSSNYRIEREITPKGKKKVYGVKIYFKNALVDETRYCLSESDRRALALSVFLAKIKMENNPKEIVILDDPVTSFDVDRMRNFIGIINELAGKSFCQTIMLMHYENFFRLIAKSIPDKTLIKIYRCGDNHLFKEIFESDDIFKTEYEKKLSNIIKFINAEINDISENDVRIYFETYLHHFYAYQISKNPALPGGKLHDFVVNLANESLISADKKDDLLLKLKFLNNSSHSFNSFTEEEKRNFIYEAYSSLHKL